MLCKQKKEVEIYILVIISICHIYCIYGKHIVSHIVVRASMDARSKICLYQNKHPK